MKSLSGARNCLTLKSLPPRGAWIEILYTRLMMQRILGRSPHGERGLKYLPFARMQAHCRRSPHGERGLKLEGYRKFNSNALVATPTGSVD